jgi:transposase
VEHLGFVDKYSPYTKRFEAYVSVLCEKMTLTDAAAVDEIDWKAAKRIDKKYLSRLVTGLEDPTPKKLGIDEIAYERGHRYLTVVRDLEIGRVIWVGATRRKEALDAFFASLNELGEARRSAHASRSASSTCGFLISPPFMQTRRLRSSTTSSTLHRRSPRRWTGSASKSSRRLTR